MYTQTQWGCEASDAVNVRYCVGGFNGFDRAKREVFKVSECKDSFIKKRETRKEGERAPWMEIVESEANFARGKPESDDPLNKMIKHKYFAHVKCSTLDPEIHGWCASFASWALSKAGYNNPMSPSSGDWLNHSTLKKIKPEEVVFGTIVVFRNKVDGKEIGTGHVAFVYGIYKNNKGNDGWVCLGGNQSNHIKFSHFRENNDGGLDIVGFYLPKDYELAKADILTDTDNYTVLTALNNNINKNLETKENDDTH
jgi:uncharacterized protein (TIGR02594 family)